MSATPLPSDGGAVAPLRRTAPARMSRTATSAQPARPHVTRPVDAPPHLHAVPIAPGRRHDVATWLYGALVGTILSLGVLGIVALNALAAEASFQARALETDISDLTLRHDDMVAAVATLAAPGRVREAATIRLGLIEPEQPGFLTLHADQLVPAGIKPRVRLGE